MSFEQHVFGIPDMFDRDSVRFDDGLYPPGWAARIGVPVRIISHSAAHRAALLAIIMDCLICPARIWVVPGFISRDAFIELSRAYPPLSTDEKKARCSKMARCCARVLAAVSEKTLLRTADDFSFVLKCGGRHVMWDKDTCDYCKRVRTSGIAIVVMRPCAHILCNAAGCIENVCAVICCPLCARESKACAMPHLAAAAHSDSESTESSGTDLETSLRGVRAISLGGDIPLAIPAEIIAMCERMISSSN